MIVFPVLSLFATFLSAHPLKDSVAATFLQERSPSFEWTAWGDSYASGVGTEKYMGGRRCLRYDLAYPVDISEDPKNLLPGSGGKFNNAVCSGAKCEEVEEFQFYTEDQSLGHPNWQFYPRPSSGKPTMGTMTVGGDDIDFPGILNNCIVDGFPWPLSTGFTRRTCDEQRALSWSLISQDGDHNKPSAELVAKMDKLFKKTVKFGQSASGTKFRLYVTGYGQFFNAQDPGCDSVTFARKPNDGQPHTMMTTTLRADFNAMSRTLNAAIQQAVGQNSGSNVKYIDVDGMLHGHRFCEPGIQEPDENNPNLWFWHYPYNLNDDATNPAIKYLNSVERANLNSLTWNPKSTLWVDYLNEFWSKVDEQQLLQSVGAANESVGAAYNFWSDTIGNRARIFHPQFDYHIAIYEAIVNQYKKDTAAPATAPTPTPKPAPSPVTPLTEQAIVCHNGSNFLGHGDIDGAQEGNFADSFCTAVLARSKLIYPPSQWPSKHTGFNLTVADDHGINYSYMIKWVEGCVTTVRSIKIEQPVPDPKTYPCAGLLANNYWDCKNGGVGGSTQAGCVKYTFTGGLGAPPPCDKCTGVKLPN